jgi:hypothetical protein
MITKINSELLTPYIHVTRSAPQSVNNSSRTVLTLNTVSVDSGHFSLSANAIVVPANVYRVCVLATVGYVTGSGNQLIEIMQNSTSTGTTAAPAPSGWYSGMQMMTSLSVVPGDAISLKSEHNNGSALSCVTTTLTVWEI